MIISHRGNLEGRKSECENNPTYIQQALDRGFNVEIDVWHDGGEFFLGHDAPTYLIDVEWLMNRSAFLWCHAKNLKAMERLLTMRNITCFWHEADKMTLTSSGVPWMYPGNYSEWGISVELGEPISIPPVRGICTDHSILWQQRIYENSK